MKKSLFKRLDGNNLASHSWDAYRDDTSKWPDDTWIIEDLRYHEEMNQYTDQICEARDRYYWMLEKHGRDHKYTIQAKQLLDTLRREYAQIRKILKEESQ